MTDSGTAGVVEPTAHQVEAARKWLEAAGRATDESSVLRLAPYVATGSIRKGSPEARAWAWLVFHGQTPTPAAVADRVRVCEQRRVRSQRRARREAALHAVVNTLDLDWMGPRVGAWIDGFVALHGHGPLWAELAEEMGWDRSEAEEILTRLAARGWVSFTSAQRSLRSGTPDVADGPSVESAVGVGDELAMAASG